MTLDSPLTGIVMQKSKIKVWIISAIIAIGFSLLIHTFFGEQNFHHYFASRIIVPEESYVVGAGVVLSESGILFLQSPARDIYAVRLLERKGDYLVRIHVDKFVEGIKACETEIELVNYVIWVRIGSKSWFGKPLNKRPHALACDLDLWCDPSGGAFTIPRGYRYALETEESWENLPGQLNWQDVDDWHYPPIDEPIRNER